MNAPCDRPIEFGALVDYWLGDGPRPEVDTVEEHLFGCDSCGGRLRALAALGDGIRRLAHDGAVEMVVTPSFLARAAEEGLRTREYRVAPGGRVDCTVTPEDDLLVGRLVGDFRRLSRLDLVTDREGQPARRIEDVAFNPEATELILAQSMPYMRAMEHARIRIRLVGQEAGGEHMIGEYTFDHTPTRG